MMVSSAGLSLASEEGETCSTCLEPYTQGLARHLQAEQDLNPSCLLTMPSHAECSLLCQEIVV